MNPLADMLSSKVKAEVFRQNCNWEGIAGSQGDCGFEGVGCPIHFRRHFMPKLKGNRLGIAEDVDRIPGFEQESLRAGAFGCRHSEIFTHGGILSARALFRLGLSRRPA